jgi:signal transduction histidine kinase
LLTAVSGSLALLEPYISDERSVRLLRVAQRGASRGAKLTESLLAFARASTRSRRISIPSPSR